MDVNGFIWNNYLQSQYLWDGTCGYHAINNTLNLMHLINNFKMLNLPYDFITLLKQYNTANYHNAKYMKNYFIYLNNGKKRTTLNDLQNIKKIMYSDDKLYFWNSYDDKIKIKYLINNKINGTFGIVIYHNEWWVKHWYGLVIDIDKTTINVNVVDSFNLIFPYKNELKNILNEMNISNVKWHNKYSQFIIYSYKIYQCIIFITVYFMIIYALLYLLNGKNKLNNI